MTEDLQAPEQNAPERLGFLGLIAQTWHQFLLFIDGLLPGGGAAAADNEPIPVSRDAIMIAGSIMAVALALTFLGFSIRQEPEHQAKQAAHPIAPGPRELPKKQAHQAPAPVPAKAAVLPSPKPLYTPPKPAVAAQPPVYQPPRPAPRPMMAPPRVARETGMNTPMRARRLVDAQRMRMPGEMQRNERTLEKRSRKSLKRSERLSEASDEMLLRRAAAADRKRNKIASKHKKRPKNAMAAKFLEVE